MEDYLEIARKVFEGTRYKAADEDIKRLADNMYLLEKRGLIKLNKRLIDARNHTNIFATIAEYNFAVMLVSRHSSAIPIRYEPDLGSQRPPDFKVEIENITYWIQMKDLSKLERENRQEKLMQKIKEKAKEIKVGKFFSCMLSSNFKEDCVLELICFMKEQAPSAIDEKSVQFISKNNQRTEITFWSPEKIELSELTLGYAGDLEMLNLTGLTCEQIKKSLLNAVGAFNLEVDENNINLIVMEADNKEDIDICDALFGTEYARDKQSWSRSDDGLFAESDFLKKVAGVITMKRKPEKCELSPQNERTIEVFARECNMTLEQYKERIERNTPISDYSLILYVNNSLNHLVEKIKRLLSFDRIIHYSMRPPMGEGNFGC